VSVVATVGMIEDALDEGPRVMSSSGPLRLTVTIANSVVQLPAVSASRQPVWCPTVCSSVCLSLRLLVSVCVAPCHWKRKRSDLVSEDGTFDIPRIYSPNNYHLNVMRWLSTANRRAICLRRLTFL